jgi:hypothetical protein
MKYIFRTADLVYDLTKYEDYLHRLGAMLRSRITGCDLLHWTRLGPAGAETLHDSRLQATRSWHRSESAGDSSCFEVKLKGPYFDRYFVLTYFGVSSVSLSLPAAENDLLVHEVRLEGESLVHELLFDQNHTIQIDCQTIQFEEFLNEQNPKSL